MASPSFPGDWATMDHKHGLARAISHGNHTRGVWSSWWGMKNVMFTIANRLNEGKFEIPSNPQEKDSEVVKLLIFSNKLCFY